MCHALCFRSCSWVRLPTARLTLSKSFGLMPSKSSTTTTTTTTTTTRLQDIGSAVTGPLCAGPPLPPGWPAHRGPLDASGLGTTGRPGDLERPGLRQRRGPDAQRQRFRKNFVDVSGGGLGTTLCSRHIDMHRSLIMECCFMLHAFACACILHVCYKNTFSLTLQRGQPKALPPLA